MGEKGQIFCAEEFQLINTDSPFQKVELNPLPLSAGWTCESHE